MNIDKKRLTFTKQTTSFNIYHIPNDVLHFLYVSYIQIAFQN